MPASTPGQQPQIGASVEVVRLSVAVVHESGGVVPPLTIDDFTVYDNDVLQEVRLLRRPEDTPLRVALLLDASPSLRPWWTTVQRAAISFVAKMGARGCPYMLPFSDGIGPGMWGRWPANTWREFLADARHGDGTSLHDALVIALDKLEEADAMAIEASQPLRETEEAGAPAGDAGDSGNEPGEPRNTSGTPGAEARPESVGAPAAAETVTRAQILASLEQLVAQILVDYAYTHAGNCDLRYVPPETASDGEGALLLPDDESVKAVLLLSDGADTTSVATPADVIDAARVANVPVFPVLLGTASTDRDLAELMQELARATGGLVTEDVAVAELGTAYDRILELLRSTYILAYQPHQTPSVGEAPTGAAPDPIREGWHEVRVELRRPLLRTIVRAGYYR